MLYDKAPFQLMIEDDTFKDSVLYFSVLFFKPKLYIHIV